MSAKLAKLIKEARTNAGLTQQALADQIPGLSAADISKAEHNEKEPTQEQLKAIAKATGVTQKSLLEAASAKTKTTSAKSGTSKTSASSKNTASGKTASKSTTTTSSMKLTAAEKKLIELYRKADSDSKKAALKALKGEENEINDLLASILGGAVGAFLK